MGNINIWKDNLNGYKLIDSGNKEKLEEINGIKIKRAEPRAWWKKEHKEEWVETETELDTELDIGIAGIKSKIRHKKSSKHLGIFPEQFSEWRWIEFKIKNAGRDTKVLNLFGYTGIASLIAGSAGAKVTHIDASKTSIEWAKENQKLSGMGNLPIRWILDDCVKFLKKEIRRGEKYDAIIMDPPSYGKGPKGEVWKIEEQLPDLLQSCKEILSDNPLFIIFNMYSTELSSISVGNLLSDITKNLGGTIEVGELTIPQQNSERLVPMSIFAKWEK